MKPQLNKKRTNASLDYLEDTKLVFVYKCPVCKNIKLLTRPKNYSCSLCKVKLERIE
jgi:hypothetical protein